LSSVENIGDIGLELVGDCRWFFSFEGFTIILSSCCRSE